MAAVRAVRWRWLLLGAWVALASPGRAQEADPPPPQPPNSPLVDGVIATLKEAALGAPLLGEPEARLPRADAQLQAAQRLTLLDAWRVAMTNEPVIRAARAATAGSRERMPQATAQLLPNVLFSASRAHNALESQQGTSSLDDRYPSSNQALTLRQPLFRPQQLAQLRQAQHQVDDAEAILARETQNLAIRVSAAYFDAMLARDQLALIRSQKSFVTALRDSARKSFDKGAGTRTDIDEAQARLDMNLAQELEATQQVAMTTRQLEALVLRPIGALALLDPQSLDLEPPAPAVAEEWVGVARQASPELRSIAAQQAAAEAEVDRVRAGHLPTLDLTAQRTRSRSENVLSPQSSYSQTSVGLQFSLPLYAGGYVNSLVRQAAVERERLGEVLEATRQDLGVRVHREFRGVTEGAARVRALQAAVKSAEVALDSARKSRQAGTRTTLDVLNAEQRLVQAQRDFAEACYLSLLARVKLHALAGMVDEALIARVSAALR